MKGGLNEGTLLEFYNHLASIGFVRSAIKGVREFSDPNKMSDLLSSLKANDSREANDGIDSFVIADFARCGRITIKPWKGAQYLALQRLTRHRLHITECIAREKVYMLNNIFLKFSEFAFLQKDEHPFSNKYGVTAEAILTEFTTTEEIVNSSVEDLVDMITARSRGRIANPLNTAELLQKAARDSYRLDKCMYEPLTTSIACSFNCIRAFEKEQRHLLEPEPVRRFRW